MITASRFRPEPAIQQWLTTWLEHLAAGEADRAAAMLDEPNCYGITWGTEDIESILDETYSPGSRFRQLHPRGLRFTTPDVTSGDPHFSISPFVDRSGYSVEHDLPVNGVYSDLTARFEFRWRGNQLAAILHDMLVM